MNLVSDSDFHCKTYTLANINPDLAKRITAIQEKIKSDADPKVVTIFRGMIKELEQHTVERTKIDVKVKELSSHLQALQRSIQNLQKAQFPTAMQTTKLIDNCTVQVRQNFTGAEEVRAKLLQQFSEKKDQKESEINEKNLALGTIEKKLISSTSAIEKLKKSSQKGEYLEALLREFKGDEIDELDTELQNFICIRERFKSFVNDVRRPLLHFLINGEKAFDKSQLVDTSNKSLTELVVRDLEKNNLNIADFYKVLEFFHQGGTTEGYRFLTDQLCAEGLSPKGIGPGATVELKIEKEQTNQFITEQKKQPSNFISSAFNWVAGLFSLRAAPSEQRNCTAQPEQGKLTLLVSNAFYVIQDPLLAEAGVSLGIVESQGKKQCTSVYDFEKGTVNLSIATIPFNKGEVDKINAESFLQTISKE